MVVSGLMGLQSFWGEMIKKGYELPFKNIVYIGVHDQDDYEKDFVAKNDIKFYTRDDVRKYGTAEIVNLVLREDLSHVDNIHVSFDVDVMDPFVFPCTGVPVPDGLSFDEVTNLMGYISSDHRVKSLDVVEFNPMVNPTMVPQCIDVLRNILSFF
jgi:arginase